MFIIIKKWMRLLSPSFWMVWIHWVMSKKHKTTVSTWHELAQNSTQKTTSRTQQNFGTQPLNIIMRISLFGCIWWCIIIHVRNSCETRKSWARPSGALASRKGSPFLSKHHNAAIGPREQTHFEIVRKSKAADLPYTRTNQNPKQQTTPRTSIMTERIYRLRYYAECALHCVFYLYINVCIGIFALSPTAEAYARERMSWRRFRTPSSRHHSRALYSIK